MSHDISEVYRCKSTTECVVQVNHRSDIPPPIEDPFFSLEKKSFKTILHFPTVALWYYDLKHSM